MLIRAAEGPTSIDDDDTANTLAKAIRDDLEEEGLGFPTLADTTDEDDGNDIAFSSYVNPSNGISIFRGEDDNSAIGASGNYTLNFRRVGNPTGSSDPFLFDPMDIDGAIRFYGCVVVDNGRACDPDGTDDTLGNCR